MNKKFIIYFVLAFALIGVGYAIAQSTARPSVIGTQSIVGGFSKWAPISTSNPLPVISQ